MKVITISIAIISILTGQLYAYEEPAQIIVRAEFISVPKVILDNVWRSKPDQLPSAKMILGFLKDGQATILYAPTVMSQSGAEFTVKAVQEVIYPTKIDIDSRAVTNVTGNASIATIIHPSDFETREVGAIFTVLPETSPNGGNNILLTFTASLISPPIWKKYTSQYIDSAGHNKQIELEQPFFYTKSICTIIMVKPGIPILASGGMNDLKNENVVFLIIKAQLLDAAGKQIIQPPRRQAPSGQPFPNT